MIYYVATTGNDTTGDGSVGNPWLTLTKAETAGADGDTVNVGAGIFEEATYLTIAKQIAWVGAGLGVTFLRSNNNARVLYLNSTKTKSMTGITIDGTSSGLTPSYLVEGSGVDQAMTFDECGFVKGETSALRLVSNMKGVVCNDCVFDAFTETQIVHIAGGNAGFELNSCTINVPTGLTMNGVIYQSGAATSGTFKIHDCDITVLSNYSPIRMIGGGFADAEITDNRITVGTNNSRAIVDLLNMVDTCLVARNTIIIPGTNTATNPIKCQSTVGTGPDCVYTIDDNIIETHNPDGYGILLGDEGGDINSKAAAFDGSFIRGNILRYPPYWGEAIGNAHAIMMGGNKNIFYENNHVYGAAYAAACKQHGEAWTDGYIRNNVFENCTYSVRMKGQSSIRCCNNVIINSGGMAGTSLSVTENGVGEDSENAFLRNNLCIRDADKVYEFMDTSFDTLDADYLGVYLTGTAQLGTEFPAATYDTLAEWQAATGHDLNGISGNPNIKVDYTIDASSIFYQKGVPVKGVTDIEDVSSDNLIVLAGAATFSLDSPYKNRVPV